METIYPHKAVTNLSSFTKYPVIPYYDETISSKKKYVLTINYMLNITCTNSLLLHNP